MSKLKVGVIFGGRTVEHEVSIVTAHQVMEQLNRDKYEIVPLYINKQGLWYTGEGLTRLEGFKNLPELLKGLTPVFLMPDLQGRSLLTLPKGLFARYAQQSLDIAFPAIHGTYGEDGSLQGLLELLNIPYVGAPVLGSALGMDKIAMKAILRDAGLPVVKYMWVTRSRWESQAQEVIKQVEENLPYPVIIKPANLGSSIGITRANKRDELSFGLDVASQFSRRLIVEEALENFTEINCSVMGNFEDIKTSLCEQPMSWKNFLSYEDKYLHGKSGAAADGGRGMSGAARKLPAPIPDELTRRIQDLAGQTFRVLDCQGIARIDFLVDKQSRPYVNEINTLPGSFSYYLWEPLGISFSQLLDRLIDLALESHKDKNQSVSSISTNLLQQTPGGKFKL